jgi:hypothetical protein
VRPHFSRPFTFLLVFTTHSATNIPTPASSTDERKMQAEAANTRLDV